MPSMPTMPKPSLKIWMEEPKPHHLGVSLLRFLRQHFDVTMDKDNPDILFFSRRRFHSNIHYPCVRVFYDAQHSPQSIAEVSDWELGYVRHDGAAARQVYMPNWLFLDCARLIAPPEDASRLMREKTGFCAFIHHQPHPVRNQFYTLFASHRRVDALGDMFRNRPRPRGLEPHTDSARLEQLAPIYRKYKFIVSFESNAMPGYVTEKLVCPLLARSVPIYWGDPRVLHLINPACFINAHDFDTPQALVEHVMKVDADDALYRRYLAAPVFLDGKLPLCVRHTHLRDRILALAEESRAPHFLPQAQRSIFLREHLSRLERFFLQDLLPSRIVKSGQAWSDPHRALQSTTTS